MATATPQQILQQLSIAMTGSLVNGAATITDTTQYGGIGIAPPSTVKVLLQILDPTGNLFYQNVNWNAGTFGTPDLQPIAGTLTYSFTMPTDINGNYLTGGYTINVQVQVVENGVTTVVQKTLYGTICNCCNGITLDVEPSVSYNTAQISVTDDTQYGAYIGLTRVLTLYAPPPSLQAPQVGNNVTTLLWVPPHGTFPSTGTWTYTLASTITYLDAVTQAQTTCEITTQGTFDVVQSQLCVVFCQLSEWRNKYWHLVKNKNVTQLTNEYDLAINEYVLAMAATTCGRPQSQIDKYIAKVYEITGIDPLCPCSCNTGVGQPLVPTNAINGTNGLNGSNFLQGVGVPATGLGAVGDSYLDSATGNIYKKTGATTWTFTENILGGQGIPGVNGSNGEALIYNDAVNRLSTTTGFATLSSFNTVPSNSLETLVNVGDELELYAIFKAVNYPCNPTIDAQLVINGTGLSNTVINKTFNQIGAANNGVIEMFTKLTLVSNTAGDMFIRVISSYKVWQVLAESGGNPTWYTLGGSGEEVELPVVNIGGASVDFAANAYNISAQANSQSIGDCELQNFRIKKLTYGTGQATGIVSLGVYANNVSAAAAGVAIGQWYTTTGTGALTQRLF